MLFIDLFVVITESEDVGIDQASCQLVSIVYYLLELLDLCLHFFLLQLASLIGIAELRLQLGDFASHLLYLEVFFAHFFFHQPSFFLVARSSSISLLSCHSSVLLKLLLLLL